MLTVYQVLNFVFYLYFLALLTRMVVSWVMVAARDWRPRGVVLLVVETAFTVTDPPIKALRKVLPPFQLGPLRLDLAFMVVFLALIALNSMVGYLLLSVTPS